MKKILTIGGSDVAFECAAVTPFYYKQEFRHDYFGDLLKLSKAMGSVADFTNISFDELDHVDFDAIGRFAWACAKTADKETKPYVDWLIDNPDFSVFEHGAEIAQLVIDNISPKKK